MGIEATFALMAAVYLILRAVQALRHLDFSAKASDRELVFSIVVAAIAIVLIVISVMGAYHIYDLPEGGGGAVNGDDFDDDFDDEDEDFDDEDDDFDF